VIQFELVFKGELVEGFSPDQARINVGKLFKASPAQVEQMFSGKSVVLRNKLDSDTAKKYRAILYKNGAVCTLREMGGQHFQKASAAQPETKSTLPQAKNAGESASQDSATADQSSSMLPSSEPPVKRVQTGTGLPIAGEKVDDILADINWDIAPPGARMEDEHDQIPLPELDLSHLSIAPPGSDMGEKKKDPPPPPPDTSHFRLK
jgi:hypothetical protein